MAAEKTHAALVKRSFNGFDYRLLDAAAVDNYAPGLEIVLMFENILDSLIGVESNYRNIAGGELRGLYDSINGFFRKSGGAGGA